MSTKTLTTKAQLESKIDELEGQLEAAHSEIADLNDQIDELEDKRECADLEHIVHRILDCVDRPVGTLCARIPETAESARALIALFDAVERGI